uniref:Thiolase N-terminal domain-containing protein n=1 Tax=Pan paniscus TaxID=9597 RepID=A0A2R9C0E6_PANPA
MQRLQVVLGHLRGPADSGSSAPSCGRFVSLGWAWGSGGHCGCSFCCRTPPPDELLSAVMTAVLKDVNLRPEQLGDICVVTSRRLCLCPLSIDSVRRGYRQWPA